MRRTSLVLAVVAAMVTVLVFTAPAFAIGLGNSDPAGPGGIDPETGTDDKLSLPIAENSDPEPPPGTTGELATDYIEHEQTVGGAPPGHHIIDTLNNIPNNPLQSPGDLIRFCRNFPADPRC